MVAIADPILAQELYKNQSNMAHAWDLGLGHFAFRYMGDSMGFAQGRKWSGHKSAFRTSLSSTAADSSLTNIAATLDEWESDILEPLAKSGEAVGLHDLVGTMPITLMMRILFGRKFVDQHLVLISQLAKDAEFIMGTIIHNQPAATVLYKFFDTEANRYESIKFLIRSHLTQI